MSELFVRGISASEVGAHMIRLGWDLLSGNSGFRGSAGVNVFESTGCARAHVFESTGCARALCCEQKSGRQFLAQQKGSERTPLPALIIFSIRESNVS